MQVVMGVSGTSKDGRSPAKGRGLIIGIGLALLLLGIVVFLSLLLGEMYSMERQLSDELIDEMSIESNDRTMLRPDQIEGFEFHRDEALRSLETRIGSFTLGNVSMLETEGEDFIAVLFHDLDKGGGIYWEFYDEDQMFRVDLMSGEILHYTYYDQTSKVGLNESEALPIATAIANQFGPLPPDRDEPQFSSFGRVELMTEDPDGNRYDRNRSTNWIFVWNRTYDGITTRDRVYVAMVGNGTVRIYSRQWHMDLEGLNTTYITTMEEANWTARALAGGNAVPTSCEKRIIRPRFGHTSYYAYGAEPMCVWEVSFMEYYEHRPAYAIVWVDARNPARVVDVVPINYG